MFTSLLTLFLTLIITHAFPHPPLGPRDANASTTNPQGTGRPNPKYSTETLNQLRLALSTVDRLNIINGLGSNDDYFKFDFSVKANANPVAGVGQGGQGDLAYVDNFPVLLNLGVAMSMGFLGPCGMNTPHTHPRATEFLLLVQGSNASTSFIQENGLTTPITTTLSTYQGAILPQGSVHYEFNDNCEPAVFVAAFSSEDPGLQRSAQTFFSEDPDIVRADLGYPKILEGVDLLAFEKTIPKAFALGKEECLKRCGLVYVPEGSG